MSKIKKLKDIQLDIRNANKGTARGYKQITGSIQRNGFGRSGLLDKNGKAIAGNKTTEASAEVFGVEAEPIVIETDGKRPVYVQRIDLDLDDPDPNNPARRLAYEDNLASSFSFELNAEQVMADMEAGFDFDAIDVTLEEMGDLLDGAVPLAAVDGSWDDAFGRLPDGEKSPFQQMTFTLHDEQVKVIEGALSLAKQQDFANSQNSNSNGNALFFICEQFINGES